MANPLLCHVQTRFPSSKIEQSHLASLFKSFCEHVHSSPSLSKSSFPYNKPITSLFQNTTIKERRFLFEPQIGTSLTNNNNERKDRTEEINRKYLSKLSELSDQCASICLDASGIKKSGILLLLIIKVIN